MHFHSQTVCNFGQANLKAHEIDLLTSPLESFQVKLSKSLTRIRMTRASALNGDGLYAIKSVNVYFDTNLAHFKPITATWPMAVQCFHHCDIG